ncbi:hypothetical protein OJF2_37700 [Aquisphaera giovannonii]|uniref:Uncharacterized protein n=1 Tax=Aquisphaera giovannonii TaxID=406548 RepID=A0A5B9W3M8_9BACT|nr:hypothetical protein OJF2_37700 [Aquisphaera giovannonii]
MIGGCGGGRRVSKSSEPPQVGPIIRPFDMADNDRIEPVAAIEVFGTTSTSPEAMTSGASPLTN